MPMYSYVCDTCGMTGDRVVKIAERDDQSCKRAIPCSESATAESCPCDGKLVREEVALTALMSHSWQP